MLLSEPPVPLPPVEQTNIVDDEPNVLGAYNVILDFERNAKTNKDALHARILGYLILHAPSIHARHEMVRVIRSCGQNQDTLYELGECFFYLYIRPFKRFGARTPTPSDHSSRASFDEDRMDLSADILEAPNAELSAKIQALIRDGFRCVVTRVYDIMAFTMIPGISKSDIFKAGRPCCLQCTHIVPDSSYLIGNTHGNSSEVMPHSTSVLAVLKRFGYDVENLNGDNAHSLHNVMTMEYDMRDFLYGFDIWFEGTNVANHYRVETVDSYRDLMILPEVTFTTTDPVNCPVPSPELLALHAACAKVANLSGAVPYIDALDQDVEDLNALACDGGSVDVLTHALMRSTLMGGSTGVWG